MQVSPTERPPITSLGPTSSRPEKLGVDILFYVKRLKGFCGIQRKEIKDLIASVQDGRLAVETAQMKQLERAMIVVEGDVRWTLDGTLLGDQWRDSAWTKAQHNGLLWSVQQRGIWVAGTTNAADTVNLARMWQRWLEKEKHEALDRRAGPVAIWGTLNDRDYCLHLIGGLPGIGPSLAARIYDTVGMPFGWKVSKEQLLAIEGLGPKKVETIWRALEHEPS